MPNAPSLLDPQTFARLQRFSLRARLMVEGYTSGVHRSPFHGFSVEFAEHREYAPGDDPRYLDWKVFGRTDKYYLKQFEEETNLVCHLLLDASESMGYRGTVSAVSKLDYAKRAAAALAYIVLHQQDSMGLATFDNAIRSWVRPSGNPSHLQDILQVLEQTEAGQGTSLAPILHEAADRLKKRGVVIVVSDFFDDLDTLSLGLKHLRYRRHEVIVMHVLDPDEEQFPFDESTMFHGLEGAASVLAEPRAIRARYQKEFQAYVRALRAACHGLSIDYVPLRTDQSLEAILSDYLASRG